MTGTLSPEQVSLIESSFQAVAPAATTLIDRFYENLFAAAPGVRSLFPNDMTEQKRHLLAAVKLVAQNAGRLSSLQSALNDMGARHVGYGALTAHYPVVRDVMLQTLSEVAGPAWNDALDDAWRQALNIVSGYMIEGAWQASEKKAA